MNNTLRAHYLEALGLPDFLYTQATTENFTAEKINIKCLVLETDNPHSFCQTGKSQDFLFKMLDAIGLKRSDVKCISIDVDNLSQTLAAYNAKTVLLMSKGLMPSAAQHFATHHPSKILINQQFKREAWEVLKKIKQCLK